MEAVAPASGLEHIYLEFYFKLTLGSILETYPFYFCSSGLLALHCTPAGRTLLYLCSYGPRIVTQIVITVLSQIVL